MINKFQKGGQSQKRILALIQLLPKELLKQIMQAFAQWAQQKGVDIQLLQNNPQALEQALGQFMLEVQSQKTQAAKYGAKLNYIKSLKHQCADDEEVVYYKKGGSIDCGCKKKEVGGKVLSAQNGAVAKFKNDKKTNQIKWTDKDEKKLDSLSTREGMNKPLTPQGKKDLKNLREKFKKSSNTKDYEVEEGKEGTKINKICGGSAISKFKAKCGSKLKKHQLGGKTLFYKKINLWQPPYTISNQNNTDNIIVGEHIMLPNLLPELEVNGRDRRLRFDRRENNIGGGRKVISESLYDYYDGGDSYLGDLAQTPAGRVIYTSPRGGNDTLYFRNAYKFIPGKGYVQEGTSRYIEGPHGYMQITDTNDPKAKLIWKSLIKSNNIAEPYEAFEKVAFKRARKEFK